jgi:signal transduction histidine kinase/CheY-like chemotaxis protein
MEWFRHLAIRRKLSLIILLISCAGALVACGVFGGYDWITFRQSMARNLATLADVLANNSTAALTFKDRATAEEILGAVRVLPDVEAAALYGEETGLFARYVRAPLRTEVPIAPGADGARFAPDRLVLFRPIVLGDKRIGTIYVHANLDRLLARLRLYAGIVVLVVSASLLVTLALSTVLQRTIARPILTLARTAREISTHRNYAVRVTKLGDDEIGHLADGLNEMLARIEERDSALRRTNVALEAEINERRKAEEGLRTLNDTLEQRVSERTAAAEQASRAKSEFLANMSHELRTPLNSVIGFANILLKNRGGSVGADDRNFIDRIVANGKHLLALINQVLDLAKVEARKVELQVAPVDLGAMVRHILAEFEGQVHGRDLRLQAHLPAGLAPLHTDADKLRQVLVNLVGNAVKFTERGTVTVAVGASGGRPRRIDVSDTGIGIPPEKHKLIFEAFRQADSTTTRKYGGTGLGLSISQALCRLMGYRIEVSSAPGRGSTFSVWLDEAAIPSVGARPAAAAAAAPAAPVQGREQQVVLVIDDDSDARLLLARLIEELGWRVVTAASGAEGVQHARELRPNLITLDLLMPEMDGWHVLRVLKSDANLAAIPVVVVSIVAQENRGLVLGVLDYVQKPVTREDLARVLKPCRATRVLVVEDNEVDRMMILACLARERVLARTAGNGHEAMEALKNGVPDLILLDLLMPEMDGLAFLDALRADERFAHLPVAVLTAKELTVPELALLRQRTAAVLHKADDLAASLRGVLAAVLRPASTPDPSAA